MRLLRCFTKKPVVLNTVPVEATRPPALLDARESDAEPRADEKQKMTMSSDRLTFSPGSPPAFVPTSIPELHPEYAHSEPYCFVPRTESARVVVDRVRGARGQPSLDRANILKEQGLVVVRGPSACAPSASNPTPSVASAATSGPIADAIPSCPPSPPSEPLSSSTLAKSPPLASVPLQVEVPSTADNTFVDSDDEPGDENANVSNIPSSVKNTPTRSSKGTPTRSKRSTGNMSFRLKGKNRKTSRNTKGSQRSLTSPILMQPNTTEEHALESDDCVRAGDDTDQRFTKRSGHGRSPSDVPLEPRASKTNTSFEEALQRAMDHTPQELLAPIVVPRTSVVFGEGLVVNTKGTPTTLPVTSSRSKDSTDSERFVDAEETLPIEPKMASPLSTPPQPKPASRLEDISKDGPSSPSTLHSVRSRRKSKPFPPHQGTPSEEPSTDVKLSPIPAPQPLSREPSLGMLSDEAGDGDTNAKGEECDKDDSLFPVRSPTSGAASRQRSEIPIDMSSYSRIQPARSALARRAAVAGKRKTVSFHDAAPIIIEPDLRAPSLSVPRSIALAKESPVESQQSIGTALWRARDSVTWRRPSIPLVDVVDEDDDDDEGNNIFCDAKGDVDVSENRNDAMFGHGDFSSAGMNVSHHKVVKEGNTIKTSSSQVKVTTGGDDNLIRVGQNSSLDNSLEVRKRSDLSNASRSDASLTSSENSFRGRSSARLSKMDKAGIQEATRRQSMAVAKAMSDQIRGVPRSAMLAYSENEVMFEEDEMKTIEDEDRVTVDGFRSTPSWHARRSSNAFRSIRVPVFKENEVPPPPPPPPFQPTQLNTRSVRIAPPPPQGHLARR